MLEIAAVEIFLVVCWLELDRFSRSFRCQQLNTRICINLTGALVIICTLTLAVHSCVHSDSSRNQSYVSSLFLVICT